MISESGLIRRRVQTGAALFLVFCCIILVSAAEPTVPRPGAFEKIIARTVALRISRLHYNNQPFDDSISEQLYDEYFDLLDRNRYIFLESDINEFASYRTELDNLLFKNNVDFAYDVYERFLLRLRDRTRRIREEVEKGFEFTAGEEFIYDRSKLPWRKTPEELDQAWTLRLKNNVLTHELMSPETKTEIDEDGMDDVVPSANPQGLSPQERVIRFYDRYYAQMAERDTMDILELFLSALARVYDPHSAYMAPNTEENFDIQMKLSLEGIGALLSSEDGYVKVVEVIPGGPAEQDGRLKAGDRIVSVAQENGDPVDVVDMPLRKVVQMIRGEKGSKVILTVNEAAKGIGSVPVLIDLVRDQVKLTEQEAKAETYYLDASGTRVEVNEHTTAGEIQGLSKILSIKLPSFYCDFEARQAGDENFKSASRDVQKLIEAAGKDSLAGVVMDLRGNGGGGLDEAVKLAGLFFSEGPVVQAKYANGSVKVLSDTDQSIVYGGPLVILTDKLSASASEIVAACIQDYNRGLVLGDTSTHGKGTVQTIYHLDRDFERSPILRDRQAGSIKFTIGKFYRVDGGATQRKGVVPDITFPAFSDHMELGENELPHALPWDSIDPVSYKKATGLEARLPLLRERSQQRLQNNLRYQEYLTYISEYGRQKERNTVPLDREQRTIMQKEQEEFSKKIERFKTSQKKRNSGNGTKPDDFVLSEALHVLADLACLNAGKNFPPDAVPESLEPKTAGSLPKASPVE